MSRTSRRGLAALLAAFLLATLVGPGCGHEETLAAGPDQLQQAQKQRGASLEGEASGLSKKPRTVARRR